MIGEEQMSQTAVSGSTKKVNRSKQKFDFMRV